MGPVPVKPVGGGREHAADYRAPMATRAIIEFGKRHAGLFEGPVLEVGSKHQAGYEQWSPRDLHKGIDGDAYLGVDIEPGDGVDLVADLTVDPLPDRQFRTIHCHCVLEHVPQVQALATAMESLLLPGGHLFVSVPFAWRVHRIPVDMWRFTPQSIDFLFPQVRFEKALCAYSTRHPSRIVPVDDAPQLPLGGDGLRRLGRVAEVTVRGLRKTRFAGGILDEQGRLLVESNLMCIGVRTTSPSYTFFPSQG